jgi:DeoR/GlpR family transcriptional regulator of sugar metabolism
MKRITKLLKDGPRHQNHIGKAITVAQKTAEELPKEPGEEYIKIKERQQPTAKRLLAEHVVRKYVHGLDAVAIDAGSTLELIVERMMQTKQDLVILTNNMTAFRRDTRREAQVSRNEFVLTGGKYVAQFDALLGNETHSSFELFNPNVIIIGASGVVPSEGFFCHGNDEKNVKHLLFDKDDCTILIPVDYTKLGKADSYIFGEMRDFHDTERKKCIIVTVGPSKEGDGAPTGQYDQARKEYEKHIKGLSAQSITVDVVPND